MEENGKTVITVKALVHAPAALVWKCWTSPEDILTWNTASDDWHTVKSENDLRPGGKFLSRMEAKDGSFGFDFTGTYEEVKTGSLIVYVMEDGRRAETTFRESGDGVLITTAFDAETINPVEMQRAGWQAIMDNFVRYVESARPGK